MGVLGPVGLDLEGGDAAVAADLDRDEVRIGPVQRLEILAPEQEAGEAGDQVAFRPAQHVAQIVLGFELLDRVAREDELAHDVGVFRGGVGGGAHHRGEPGGRRLGRAVDDELGFREVLVGGDGEEIDAGQQGRQPDDRPEPDVERGEEARDGGGQKRPGSGCPDRPAGDGAGAMSEAHDRRTPPGAR